MPKHLLVLFLVSLFLTAGCGSDESDDNTPPPAASPVPGLVLTESDTDVAGTFTRLNQALQSNAQVEVVASVNHTANAQSVDLTLRPTRLVLAGNARLGGQIMQVNPAAGIDLPQQLLVYERADGTTLAAYNDPSYLAARHGIEGIDGVLEQTRTALRQLVETGTTGTVSEPGAVETSLGEGLLVVESNADVDSTFGRLREAVEANENLSIIAEIAHDDMAATVGIDLRPTKVLVFGNPALGTPLMQSAQTMGIDLPQKMLVYIDGTGTVRVVYNDPAYLAARHRATDVDEQIDAIRAALDGLAATASGQ